jgi:hypothetical protein
MGLPITIPGAERFYDLAITSTPASIIDLIRDSVKVEGGSPKDAGVLAKVPTGAPANVLEVQVGTPDADVTIQDPITLSTRVHATTDADKLLLGPEAADKLIFTATTATLPVTVRFNNDQRVALS